MGKSQSTVANKIRLLNLSEHVQQAVLERKVTERHARALLLVKDEELQFQLLEKIIEKDLNVSETERLLDETLNPKEKAVKPQTISRMPRDCRIAMNTFKQAIMMVEKTGMRLSLIHILNERKSPVQGIFLLKKDQLQELVGVIKL